MLKAHLALGAVLLLAGAPAFAEPISKDKFSVTDGDTIRLDGEAKGTRLVGFNAPETIDARCDHEATLASLATERLEQLVASAPLDLVKIPCSCKPGTEGTDRCNFGRSCGTLRADGRDVGDILIAEGLAVPFQCGATSCPRTPRPWCE
jgi:micrococcal nuclease